VSVKDGLDTLTETADGTYTFPAISLLSTQNGPAIPPITFTMTASTSGGAQCGVIGGLLAGNTGANQSNLGSGGAAGEHMNVLCGKYPATTVVLPTVTTLPSVSARTVIGTPDIVPVYFETSSASTANEANDLAFIQQFTASKVWGLLSQYGVGSARVESAVKVTNPGFSLSSGYTVTSSDIAKLIQSQGSTLDPALTANTVFVFYLPPNVHDTYLNGSLTQLGTNAAGVTGQVSMGGATVTYAMVEDVLQAYFSGGAIYRTAEAALVSAVTNPSGTNGYSFMSADPDVWLGASLAQMTSGGETTLAIGTLCNSYGVVPQSDIATSGIVPLWSQSDATAGRNPCQPAATVPIDRNGSINLPTSTAISDPSTTFFGAVPQVATTVTGTLGGVSRTDHAIEVAPGQSVTVTFEFFSTQQLANDVAVAPQVLSYISGSDSSKYGPLGGVNAQPIGLPTNLPISFSKITNVTRPSIGAKANNGDTIQMTVTASSTPFPGMYVATLGNGILLPFAVTNGATWQ
jgi:hypothetical protein